jgi:hypothetical protein
MANGFPGLGLRQGIFSAIANFETGFRVGGRVHIFDLARSPIPVFEAVLILI